MKQRIKNWLLKKYCNVVIIDDIIKVKRAKGDIKFYLRGKELDKLILKNLKEEIEFLEHTQIWKILTNSLREEARMVMNEKAKDFNDMMSGKMLLYAIALQEQVINKLK